MNIMDRQEAINYIIAYKSNKNFDFQRFLMEYASDCGKTDLRYFPNFIEILILTNALRGAVEYAIDYYIRKIEINTLHLIKNNNKIFITAY